MPTKVSELDNDLEYTSFDAVIPSQIGNENKVLCTDGEKLFWNTNSSYKLFDTKILDYVLNYEESQGWALQGTYVYKEALAGTRYGYPDFYAKCLEEYQEATVTETVGGVTIKVNSNGHKFYNIADKSAIDSFFNNKGTAWFYGVDTENERIFLPRNNYFEQLTGDVSEVGQSVEAGLPNITGGLDGVVFDLKDEQQNGALTKSASLSTYCGSGSGESHNNITFNASLSNPIYGNSDTVQPNAVKKLLYICVGNTTSYEGITEVVNQGMEILEQVNQGIESRVMLDGSNAEFPYIIETYANGTSWYRVYSDGWCEQGGYIVNTATADNTLTTINLLKNFTSSNYTVNVIKKIKSSKDYSGGYQGYLNTTLSSFQVYFGVQSYFEGASWQACGYIA